MEFSQDKFNTILDATVDRIMAELKDKPMGPIYRIVVRGLVTSLFHILLEASAKLGFEKAVELFRAVADAFELSVKEMAKELGIKL